MKFSKLLWLAVATALVLAACGGSGAGPTAITEPSAVGEDAAGAVQDGDSGDITTGEENHSHDGEAGNAIEWDGGPLPVLEVTVEGDVDSGWDVVAAVVGFEFSDPSRFEHVPGQGHTHVFVDGLLVGMSYEPEVHVDGLDAGPHQARVTLSRNDHLDYAVGGEVISVTESFVVPGETAPADAVLAVRYADGEVLGVDTRQSVAPGDVVEITVESDVVDEVHVHGYNLFGDVTPQRPAVIRFIAEIPGRFEIELEQSGALLFELEVS